MLEWWKHVLALFFTVEVAWFQCRITLKPSIQTHFRQLYASDFVEIVWGKPIPLPAWRASVYKSRSIKTWFDKCGVEELPRPTQRPDLNPTKHLWDELEWQSPSSQMLLWQNGHNSEKTASFGINLNECLCSQVPCSLLMLHCGKGLKVCSSCW